jgi:glycosyltransferase involved in cell wall biosynthesis
VGYLGRIDPKKNVDLIIDAVGTLTEDVSLVVAGRGDPQLEESLRRRADRLLPGRATFVGWVGGSEKSAFLAGIDTLVMPSEYECFGVAAVEALAAGVPVIVSDRVGVAEIIRTHEVGVVVPPTAAAIAGALRRYLDDPACRTADANRARAAALADASFTAHGSRLVEVYTHLLESKRR